MSDDNEGVLYGNFGTGATEATEDEEVSASFVVALGNREQTLLFPQFKYDPRYYVRAQGTTVNEDEVTTALLPARMSPGGMALNRAQRRGKQPVEGGSLSIDFAPRVNSAFIAKCLVQITGFCFPVREKSGKVVNRQYDPAGGGDNANNREIYAAFLTPGNEFAAQLVGFLDYVAGRNSDAQADFEAFLAAHPQSLIGS